VGGRLHYLSTTIREAMRLLPALPVMPLARETRADMTLCRFRVPKVRHGGGVGQAVRDGRCRGGVRSQGGVCGGLRRRALHGAMARCGAPAAARLTSTHPLSHITTTF
jgi:hypothetical protein